MYVTSFGSIHPPASWVATWIDVTLARIGTDSTDGGVKAGWQNGDERGMRTRKMRTRWKVIMMKTMMVKLK